MYINSPNTAMPGGSLDFGFLSSMGSLTSMSSFGCCSDSVWP
jgi:hypothetical protein